MGIEGQPLESPADGVLSSRAGLLAFLFSSRSDESLGYPLSPFGLRGPRGDSQERSYTIFIAPDVRKDGQLYLDYGLFSP